MLEDLVFKKHLQSVKVDFSEGPCVFQKQVFKTMNNEKDAQVNKCGLLNRTLTALNVDF